jgi:hypothetical protein
MKKSTDKWKIIRFYYKEYPRNIMLCSILVRGIKWTPGIGQRKLPLVSDVPDDVYQ